MKTKKLWFLIAAALVLCMVFTINADNDPLDDDALDAGQYAETDGRPPGNLKEVVRVGVRRGQIIIVLRDITGGGRPRRYTPTDPNGECMRDLALFAMANNKQVAIGASNGSFPMTLHRLMVIN